MDLKQVIHLIEDYMGNEKKIKDFIHFYLGCEVGKMTSSGRTYILRSAGRESCVINLKNGEFDPRVIGTDFILPILKRLSNITEEDAKPVVDCLPAYMHEKDMDHNFIQALVNNTKYNVNYLDSIELTQILCSLGYDLFGLIDAGLAIDKKEWDAKTTLNVTPS